MPATPAWPPRSLTRLFVDTPLGAGTMVEVEGGQANYLANVMRMKAGDQLLLFDGASGEWLAEIGDAGHICTDSGHGRWPEGRRLLDRLLSRGEFA